MFVAFYEDDPDVAVLIGEVRDRFFDETRKAKYQLLMRDHRKAAQFLNSFLSNSFILIVWACLFHLHLVSEGRSQK